MEYISIFGLSFSSQLIFVLILLLSVILFTFELLAIEITAILIMLILFFSGILSKQEALAGFSNDSIIMIGSLLILIAGLKKTGVLKKLEVLINKLTKFNRNVSFVAILFLVAVISAFVSNTATLAIAIPIVGALAKKYGESPKKWLLPIAYASVLGGMNSLIGTSTNIIISSILPDYGINGLKLFSTALVGIPILIAGIIYLLILSYVVKDKKTNKDQDLEVKYNLRSYTTEVSIDSESSLVDKNIEDTIFFKDDNFTVLGINRENFPLIHPRKGFTLKADDQIVIEGNIIKITEELSSLGLSISKNVEKTENKITPELHFHEVLISGNSMLIGRTPKNTYLRNRYRIQLVAINRQSQTIRDKLSDVKFKSGDLLILQFMGKMDNNLLDFLGLIPINRIDNEVIDTKKAPLALTLFIAALLFGSITSYPLSLCALLASVLMVIFKIINVKEVYEVIQWRILIFIAAILSLGQGMVASGSDQLIASFITDIFGNVESTSLLLLFFFFITVIMTTLLSNQATAVVIIPLAVSTASQLGLDPMPIIMTVTIATSCCFATPFEPAFMLVYNPGGYKFIDFFKSGIILNIIAGIITVIFVNLFW